MKDLVDLHDGTIEVKSEVGKGTVFKMRLPLEKVSIAENAEDKPNDRDTPLNPLSRGDLPPAEATPRVETKWKSRNPAGRGGGGA